MGQWTSSSVTREEVRILVTTSADARSWIRSWPPLTPRWQDVEYKRVAEHDRLWNSGARFRVVAAGRRSGKTEYAKRFISLKAINFFAHPNGRFVCAAPTQQQARDIYWDDLKLLIPPEYVKRYYDTAPQTVVLVTGTKIECRGLEKPERLEGTPLDGIIIDEIAEVKEEAWTKSIRPALDTEGRLGWAWFIGRPKGRNHFYRLAQRAKNDASGRWSYHHWKSSVVLSAEAIRDARSDLDDITYRQEYEAEFVNFEGRAYYPFERERHCERLPYYPEAPLMLCLDFNVSPGSAVICQEQEYKGRLRYVDDDITAVIGEVNIPDNSNTRRVCRKIVQDWGDHEGEVHCYGDPSGGARKTSATEGSDWDQVEEILSLAFGNRLSMRVRRAPPTERARINAMNSRLETVSGRVRMLVDPARALTVVEDLEGVVLMEGTGELDKTSKWLTHWTDGLGYYVQDRFPASGPRVETVAM